MTTFRERKTDRKAVLRSLYGAVERNRPEISGATLRDELTCPTKTSPRPATTSSAKV
jgi:hypothetical protein